MIARPRLGVSTEPLRACFFRLSTMAGVRHLLAVLRHRDFRLLWLAQSASVIGDRIVTVALALFVIDLTGSATDLGLVLAAHALPLVAFLLIGGVWADRLPRQRVMIATDLARFALHALLAVLIITGEVRDLAGRGDRDAVRHRRGVLPPRRQRAAAADGARGGDPGGQRAHDDVQQHRRVRRAGVGDRARARGRRGRRLRASTPRRFLVSAAFLVRVRPRRRGAAPAASRRATVWREMREGFEEVRSRAWVWATLAAFCVALFVALAPWYVLGPVRRARAVRRHRRLRRWSAPRSAPGRSPAR